MKVSIRSGADGPDTERYAGLRGARLGHFRRALLRWYVPRARPLRIRLARDPWAILVSEVMAQQTQIARADEAWAGFMERFPSPAELARASTAEVLRSWAGLGYNRRARDLQRAAVAIEHDHAGLVPADLEALEALPGIGPYTARAVAAIAFGRPVAAVDTNVRRVVSRISGGQIGARRLQAVADALVDARDPRTWAYATMELGATVCVARRPRCGDCPVQRWCASAGRVPEPRARSAPKAAAVPFEHTARWLRGRIVARLRTLEEGGWTHLPARIGDHDEAAVTTAIAALVRDGLVERRPDGAVRLPSA
jgi:A/G-specific adenine glycosylase